MSDEHSPPNDADLDTVAREIDELVAAADLDAIDAWLEKNPFRGVRDRDGNRLRVFLLTRGRGR